MALGRATGVSCTDMINPESLEVESITHDMENAMIVGSIKKGDGSIINHGGRESVLLANGELMSGHFVSTGSGVKIGAKIPLNSATEEDLVTINKQALSRAQHWHDDALKYQKGERLDEDVRLVTSGSESKVLIPTVNTGTPSGMNRFFKMNKDESDYFDGRYADDAAKVVEVEGTQHVVVNKEDYDEMLAAFEDNLNQKADVSTTDGYTINLDTGNAGDSGSAYVKLNLIRKPVAEVMEDHFAESGVELDGDVVSSVHVMKAAGEAATMETTQALLSEAELLQQQIFGGDDEDDDKPAAALSAPMTITTFDNGTTELPPIDGNLSDGDY